MIGAPVNSFTRNGILCGQVVDVEGQEIRAGEVVMVEIRPVPLLLGGQESPIRIVVGRLGQEADRAGPPWREHVRAAQAQIGDEIVVEALERERAVISRGESGGAVGDAPVAVEPALELADDRRPAGDRGLETQRKSAAARRIP